jgi:hypothetical protein
MLPAIHLAVLLAMMIAMPGALSCPPRLCTHDAAAAHASSSLAPPPVPVALSTLPARNAENVDPLLAGSAADATTQQAQALVVGDPPSPGKQEADGQPPR